MIWARLSSARTQSRRRNAIAGAGNCRAARWSFHACAPGLFFYAGQGTTGRKQPGAREVVFQQSQAVYGTPTRPTPVYTDAVRLALAFDGVETDRVAFRSVQDIQRQVVPPTAYEKARKTLDPFLDNQTKYWNAFDKDNDWLELKGHFDVPADLLTPRIKSAMT